MSDSIDCRKVMYEELSDIKAKRAHASHDNQPLNIAEENCPDVKTGLFGLAFSGGGIRSSTFGLGVLQGLAKKGVLKYVDYLSTVSGGGYIGSSLSSLLSNPEASVKWDKSFPFFSDRDNNLKERKEIVHLRNHDNYLSPGASGMWNIIGTYLTGLVLTDIFPAALIIISTYVIKSFLALNIGYFPFLVIALGLFGITLLIRAVSAVKPKEPPLERRQTGENILAFMTSLSVISGAVGGVIFLAESINKMPQTTIWWLVAGFAAIPVLGLFAGLKKTAGKILISVFRISLIVVLPLMFVMLLLQFPQWLLRDMKIFGIEVPVVLIIGFILLLLSLVIKPQRISVHAFYRDKLSEAYIIKRRADAIVENDRLKLSDLNKYNNGPYHIINATLNIPSTRNPRLRERKADFFVFSKRYCGSEATGYRKTETYYKNKLTLTTAMTTSGAAISPEMGDFTNPALAALLTVLNVRLNRWLPNPKYSGFRERFVIQPVNLIKELLCKGTENDWQINLSDGGHLENTGMYQLLARRCKYIVVSDADEHPDNIQKDLALSLRRIRIDMGVDIKIDLDCFSPDEKKCSRLHYAVGRIFYPDSDVHGYILYIQTQVTGNEPLDILLYRDLNSSFPDQTTADQFFDEAQFESYRKLGELSVDDIFKNEHRFIDMKDDCRDSDLRECFEKLLDDYEKGCREAADSR
jgi:hypothetical protein